MVRRPSRAGDSWWMGERFVCTNVSVNHGAYTISATVGEGTGRSVKSLLNLFHRFGNLILCPKCKNLGNTWMNRLKIHGEK